MISVDNFQRMFEFPSPPFPAIGVLLFNHIFETNLGAGQGAIVLTIGLSPPPPKFPLKTSQVQEMHNSILIDYPVGFTLAPSC